MNLIKAEAVAHSSMKEHGLKELGWTFRFDKGRNRFGYCVRKFNRITGEVTLRQISLSRKLTEINEEDKVLDTIKHEIAHALVGHKAGHGPIWQAKAKELGAKPEACFTDKEVNVSYKWIGSCGDCDRTYKRHRLTAGLKRSFHSICRSKENRGELTWKPLSGR